MIKENRARKIGKVGMWKKMGMNTRAISKVPCVSGSIIIFFILLWNMLALSY